MDSYLSALIAAAMIQVVGALSPGPAVALVVGTAVSQGRGAALAVAAGLAAGSAALAVAVVAGLANLLAGSAAAMLALKILGGVYLLWLALGAFKRAYRPPVLEPGGHAGGGSWRLVAQGFAFQITNPKSLFVWVAVSAVSGVHGAPAPILALFVANAFAISFVAHGGWGLALATAPARAAYARARRWVDGALGAIFGTTGVAILTGRT